MLFLGRSPPGFAGAAPVVPTVIDGDTLDLNGAAIDLPWIDAPELGQQCLDGTNLYPCGLTAAFELRKRLELEPVTCTPPAAEGESYQCRTANNSLDLLMVEDGLAVARAEGAHQSAEEAARRVPLGIWRGAFVDPGEWRQGRRLAQERVLVDQCPVLGAEVDDRRVYLVPTDPGYDVWTRSAGVQQHFCSDEDARTAGYVHYAA